MDEKKCPACGFKNSSFFLTDCDQCDCPLEAKPTEEERLLYKEVAKRRKRAEELGLPDLLGKLYHHHIKHYPSLLPDNPDCVCSLVTEAMDLTDDNERDTAKLFIKLNGHPYRLEFREFKFSTPDDVSCSNGTLTLYSSEKKVLSVSMHIRYDDDEGCSGSEWGLFKPESFIEGEWIRDFRELEKRIPADEDARLKKAAEVRNQEKIKKMKEDLGL